MEGARRTPRRAPFALAAGRAREEAGLAGEGHGDAADWDADDWGTPEWDARGPYVSERQWGTVREDYSADGDAWDYLPHDHARSRAYRWGEDGLAGFCDIHQELCLGLALWNGRDPILKERAFGLTGPQGNHGEDVKEYWWYLDAIPSHAWNRWRYHYPQGPFPYQDLVAQNAARSRVDPEYELLDTGAFDGDRYWIVEVHYAKAAPDDILMAVQVTNYHRFRGDGEKVEYPTGSGKRLSLDQVVADLQDRLISLFTRGPDGRRPCFGCTERMQADPAWKDNLIFSEYFHGDNGAAIGAFHQTGWMGLIADLIIRRRGDIHSVGDVLRRISDGLA